MTTHIPPANGSIPHRVARLEADFDKLSRRVDQMIMYLFGLFVAILLSAIGTLVTWLIYG